MAENNGHDRDGHGIEIEPVPFHMEHYRPRSPSPLKWLAWTILIVVLCLLAASAWFVFTASQVVVRIDPEPDRISIDGGIFTPRIGSNYLLRPGAYTLKASRPCYHPLEKSIRIANEKSQTLNFSMDKLSGRLSLRVHQAEKPSVAVDGAEVTIDGKAVGVTPIHELEVPSGKRHLEVRAKDYQDLATDVDIKGCGVLQSLVLALTPGWAEVTVGSVPRGADVRIDGKRVGQTPLELNLFPGTHELQISADRFKTWHTRLSVKANQPQVLDKIRLEPADGTFSLRTNPAGANVTIGDKFVGNTPLKLALRPDTVHVVRVSKAGYENVVRKVTLSSAGVEELNLDLVPIKGIVYLEVDPSDAELIINGTSWGQVQRELHLTSLQQRLEIRKEGFQPFQTTITPRPGFPQQLKITLAKPEPKKTVVPPVIHAANGYTLTLIRPGSFTMGASRREQGRRSNETLRKVKLQRPFYMGVKEVTNRAFKEFLSTHSSGFIKQYNFDQDVLPVVEVTWEQAARFCNWLSAKESLPPSYIEKDNGLVAAVPLQTGYRLPTEAEWEYCARFNNKAFVKYPWGDAFPPPPDSGNFADISAKDLLVNYMAEYEDGYIITAPPGSFKPNALGLFDMGGNVAEWSHDYYTIYPYSAGKIDVDPSGPVQGKHRVVKGSSWRDSGISELRLSYRDYSQDERQDLGFRICRYLNNKSESE